jgi:hypothetical protein
MNIQNYDFHDGKILSISICGACVELLFEQWNCNQLTLCFEDYWRIKSFNLIGQDIDGLIINSSGEIINEVVKYIIDDGGSENQANGLNVYSFVSWSGVVIFEIVARNVNVKIMP